MRVAANAAQQLGIRVEEIMKRLPVLILVAVALPGYSQTLSTALSNNGTGGIFMTLTSNSDLSVVSFDTYFGAAAGTAGSVEVYVRDGAYAGFTASNVGWTLFDTVAFTSNGTATLAAVTLNNQISLQTGIGKSVYLHSVTTGNGIRYTGTSAAPPQTTWSNADLTLFSDVSRTGAVPFGGTQFTPRTFAGNVSYQAVPEPASLAVLGLVGAAAARRRKR